MDVAKEEIVKTEELETRYERYKGILKDLTIMSDVFNAECIQETGMYRICSAGNYE